MTYIYQDDIIINVREISLQLHMNLLEGLKMKKVNVYDGTGLANVLKEIVITKETTTMTFHEDLFGFPEDTIDIKVEYNDKYNVTVYGETKTFTSEWTFKDYVYAICGW